MSGEPGPEPRARWRIRRWTDADYPLLVAANAPEMTRYLAGPETVPQLRRRHERYIRGWDEGMPRMFAIVDEAGVGVGGIGWWESDWNGRGVYETGWNVLPAYQRHGAASAALRLVIGDARTHGDRDLLMACPAVDNEASNAVCRSAGLVRRGPKTDELRGQELELNGWIQRHRG